MSLFDLLGEAISQGIEAVRPVEFSIAGFDHDGVQLLPERVFQWNPETISDPLAVGWQKKSIPGASHALQHWSQNEGRDFGFDLWLTRDMHPDQGQFGGLVEVGDPAVKRRNADIEAGVAYFRAFCYPGYDRAGYARPPMKVALDLRGLRLDESGGHVVWCVVTKCDVQYRKTFPDGTPRAVQLSLGFSQFVQDRNRVGWVDRQVLIDRSAGFGRGRR